MGSTDKRLPDARRASDVEGFLRKLAAVPARAQDGRGRLLFAIDATASRQPTWDRACGLQGEMFRVTGELGGLEVQLAYYRGFAEFRATGWIADADPLVRAMTGVACQGGQTQIARVLGHAQAETDRRKVAALVFVGDCMEEDPDLLCRLAGELGLKGTPVFVFHEGGEALAGATFRQIARVSGGAYCPFDSSSARQLRDLLRAVAVYAAGGRTALEHHARKSGAAAAGMLEQVRLLGAPRRG
ncbi:MAG: VWA domain-containing protein [Alphaproteobacteria bacterium]